MKKSKVLTYIVAGLSCLVAFDVIASYALFSAYFKTKENTNNGMIGIYSYFDEESGNGFSAENPLIITRPRHFYNLMRLQEFGNFSSLTNKVYFRVGKDINPASGGTHDDDLVVYDSDSASTFGYTLDMSSYASNFRSIGNHAVPFFSTFDGSNIIISNLTVTSEPDDVGVFGYIGEGGSLKNVIFEDLTIKSNGYSASNAGMFTTDFTTLSAKYVDTDLSETAIGDQDGENARFVYDDVQISDLDTTFGDLEITFPTDLVDSSVSYYIASSNTLLNVTNGTGSATATIDPSLAANSEFIASDSNAMVGRIYVIATKTIDLVPYSRVIGSYQAYLLVNLSEIDATTHYKYTLDIIKDKYDGNATTTYSQYHHENNIGIVAGHADGSVSNVYVYGTTTLDVNRTVSNYTNVDFETDIGLVGEIGDHITNTLNPDATIAGEVGFISADEIYNRVKGNGSFKTMYYENATSPKTFYSLDPVYDDLDERYSLYKNLIRDTSSSVVSTDGNYNADAVNHYRVLTDSQNNIVFKGSRVIEGNADNGLGVFDIVTGWKSGTQTDVDVSTGTTIGTYDGQVVYKNRPFSTDVSNSVSALSNTKNTNRILYVASEVTDDSQQTEVNFKSMLRFVGGEVRGSDSTPWARTFAGSGTKSPTVLTDKSLESKVYLYEATLASSEATSIKRYFANTQYTYLKDILEETLVDTLGQPIEQGDSNFGISLRTIKSDGTETNLSSVTKYLTTIGRSRVEFVDSENKYKVSWNSQLGAVVKNNYGTSTEVYDTENLEYYPFGEMNFKLNREANITVVYPYVTGLSANGVSFDNTTSPYITIHRRDVAIQNPKNGTRYPIACTPYPNTTEINNLYYYPDGGTDSTDPVKWNLSTEGNPILVHTFKLPAGEYFLANNALSFNVPYAYISVEGQDKGRLSGFTVISFTSDVLENVDFLISSPLEGGYVTSLTASDKRARITFKSDFKCAYGNGTITITTATQASDADLTFTSTLNGSVDYIFVINNGSDVEGFTMKTISINGSTPSSDLSVSWYYE